MGSKSKWLKRPWHFYDLRSHILSLPPYPIGTDSHKGLQRSEEQRHRPYPCMGGMSKLHSKSMRRASLVVQWLRIRLAMQGIQVQSLVWESKSHMPRSTSSPRCNYWAPMLWSPQATARKHCSKKPFTTQWRPWVQQLRLHTAKYF